MLNEKVVNVKCFILQCITNCSYTDLNDWSLEPETKNKAEKNRGLPSWAL